MPQQESSLKSVGLATEGVIPDINASAKATLDSLAAHERLDFANSHGQWNVVDIDLFDQTSGWYDATQTSKGHKIGSKGSIVKINDESWVIPCSLSREGPAKVPSITIQPVDQLSHAGEGDPQPSVWFECTAVGTLPMTFSWEVLVGSSTSWQQIVLDQAYDAPQDTVTFSELQVFYGVEQGSSSSNPISSNSITSATPGLNVAIRTKIRVDDISDDEGSRSNVVKVRCRINNSSAGGGHVLSNTASYKVKDETGC